ncbi:helix-turn-helix domain-containing protein [Mycolicibacterium mageritense]|uniref:helix-turn-helix domain-containing protein n=1 Tax=Mycolicibacterium mageritense TaxID=53462 RepID=UPI0023F209D2|nr:helix-turn-helix domain-containing protein [Mycolicibacterium mageritense]
MNVPTNPALPEVLTVNELARGWRVDPDVIRDLIKTGALKGYRVGKQFRVTVDDAIDFFNRQAVTA